MIFNYLKIAFRTIRRDKFYAIINISGLALGLAISIIIMLFVKDELSFDKHHSKADQIYRAIMVWGKQNGQGQQMPIGPYRLKPALDTDFPQIAKSARLVDYSGSLITYGDKNYVQDHAFFADPELFEMFDFEFVQGDPATALSEPFSVVIAESTARKIFGEKNPVGESLEFRSEGFLKVTGVYKDLPNNTHLNMEALVSMASAPRVFNQLVLNNWGEGSSYTYMLLEDAETVSSIESQIPDFIEKNLGEGASEGVGIELQKMTDIHLHSNLPGEIQANSDIKYIYISVSIALFIILLACINYMNLATARSIKRSLEIGVRKTLGAPRTALIKQFLSESTVISFLGLLFALVLVLLTLPAFNNFVEKSLSLDVRQNYDILLGGLILTLAVGLLSGSYPALYLSKFGVTRVFRESKNTSQSSTLRKVLVSFQFFISVTLIFATVVVFQQWNFLKNKDLGINRENLIMVPIPDLDQYQALKSQLLQDPSVLSVGGSNKQLTGRLGSNLGFKAEQFEPDPNGRTSIKIVTTDHDFFKTLEVDFVAGRDFSREFGSDDTSAFILNQAAVDFFGWDDPVGKRFETSEFNDGSWVPRRGAVIGVVDNYNHESLYNTVEPVAYYISKTWLNWMTIRIGGDNVRETLAGIQEKWTQFASEELYEFNFLDDRIDEMYRAEERFFRIFTFFAMMAIFIAGIGILGLSAFMATQRKKEIGVRKVLGASVLDLSFLLIKEFAVLLLVGYLIAVPVTYYFLQEWLAQFTYQIHIGWVPFILAASVALVMTLVSSGGQLVKAALANPVNALRSD